MESEEDIGNDIQKMIENRLKYKIDDSKMKYNSSLAHNRQLDAYRRAQKSK